MATIASVKWSSPLHVQGVLRIGREERLPGTCLTCIANGNADKQRGSWHLIGGSPGLKSRFSAQSTCWQSLKERQKLRGSVLRAAADSEAENVEAQDIPQAASPDSFLSYEEAGLVEFATNLDMHERFLARLTISSLNLLRVISKQEGVPIEELNAGRVVDWFSKDKEKRKEDVNSAVLKWPSMPDDDFQNSIW
ncbi:hypothetical protein KFL_001660010 [Klebsormidium nitens]|uniref:Uncharacterized protein n=1 Tax=Klebsormidium nitens TaxID=105231 RepID=A0A1Y1HYY2_KLENI|nr:hypothetical protein KFL_001660010 [Klebsormidium nitens]|eukprot:GAQ83864.1 hypothetical protein KFL_001660010 [Klebsormidium nitens]